MAQALKYFTHVKQGGKVELDKVPLKPGTKLEVILLETDEQFEDLVMASESSLEFWNNSIDDEVWNNA
jgi:predicted DNA-binding antitoxin AbrB/MazE fold protein